MGQRIQKWKYFKLFWTKRCAILISMDKLYLSHPLLTINCTSPKNDQILSNFCLVDLWEKNINSSYRLSDSIFLTNFACRRKAFFLCFVSSDYYAKKMLPRFFISIKQGEKWYIRFSRPSWHDKTKKSVFGIGSCSLLFRKRNFFSK